MDTKQLQVFIAVGSAGSFSKAALDLNVTQPMITRHI
ncbi:MAG: LysR family transcriptional regulator, partial [Mesorhizobium sp.]